MSADSSAIAASASTAPVPAAAIAPLPERAAIMILGTMITLIIVLMVILAETTRVNPASAVEYPPLETDIIAQR